MTTKKRVPVTILTGFLGSGKTTLLNHILKDDSHGMRFAVIENEFGEIGVDQRILNERVNDEVIEVINGCICCKVRGDLVDALNRLYKKVDTFDGVIIETTGLADPAPVVQTFFAEVNSDSTLEEKYKLDAIITVVDAKYIIQRLDETKGTEAEQQVCMADKIILNKMDLVQNDGEADDIEDRLRSLNPTAPIFRCSESKISPKELLNVGSFDLEKVLEIDPFFLGEAKQPKHDNAVSSISAKYDGNVNRTLLEVWIRRLLKDYSGDQLYRYKGICSIQGQDERMVFQGVGHFFNSTYGAPWKDGEKRESTFVFIGRNLDTDTLRDGFEACREGAPLRFDVGTEVQVNIGQYVRARVLAHWDEGHAYRVHLLDEGTDVFAPVDIDQYIREANPVPRFPVGTRVECNMGPQFVRGTVIAHWDSGNPYRVKLEGNGMDVCAPKDDDKFIRKAENQGDLRFDVGTRVEANMGQEYLPGTVIAQWDMGNAYRVRLDGIGSNDIWAPVDDDKWVRLLST